MERSKSSSPPTFKKSFKILLSKYEDLNVAVRNLENHDASDNATPEENKKIETVKCSIEYVNINHKETKYKSCKFINSITNHEQIEKDKGKIRGGHLFQDSTEEMPKNQSKDYLNTYKHLQIKKDVSMKKLNCSEDKLSLRSQLQNSVNNIDFVPNYVVIKNSEQSRKLLVGNLSQQTTEENLMYYFCQFGQIEKCVILRNPKSRISTGLGYLIFQHSCMVTDAYHSAPHTIDSQTIFLFASKEGEADPEHFCTLFVRDLSWKVTEKRVLQYFEKWGKIIKCVVKNKYHNHTKFAFVTYKYSDMMVEVLKSGPHRIGNNIINIRISNQEPEEPEEYRKLIIKNITYDISERLLIDYFKQFGKVVTCYISGGEIARKLQETGYVIFENSFDLQIIENNQPHEINDKELALVFPEKNKQMPPARSPAFKNTFAYKKNKQMPSAGSPASKNTFAYKKEKSKEKNLLDALERSKVLKSNGFKLNDFDGAGVNIFRN